MTSLPSEIWSRIVKLHYEALTEDVKCTACQEGSDSFEGQAARYLFDKHGLQPPWDLPLWTHLAHADRRNLFELRTVCQAFNHVLKSILLDAVMMPLGSPVFQRFMMHFAHLPSLPAKSLECTTPSRVYKLLQLTCIVWGGILRLDDSQKLGELEAGIWRDIWPSEQEILREVEILQRCHSLRNLSVTSVPSHLANTIIGSVASTCLVSLELGELHKLDRVALGQFFEIHGPTLRSLSLQYDPAVMEAAALLQMLEYTSRLISLRLSLLVDSTVEAHSPLDEGRRHTFLRKAPPDYSYVIKSLSEVLQRLGQKLVSLSIPSPTLRLLGEDSMHRQRPRPPLSENYRILLKNALTCCSQLNVLVFTSSSSLPTSKLTHVKDLEDLLSCLPELRMLDVSAVELSLADYHYLKRHHRLRLVQLGHVPHTDQIMGEPDLEGSTMLFDTVEMRLKQKDSLR